ncbi:hypothetical protein [uncultured Amnibacterium sp.]|uniref:hypothetical protein n=1 Tax=uncultured Amnibacterium sp. TaxID=1631851 RepID=UPI0035CA8F83
MTASLLRFFLRAKPVRTGGIILSAAAVVVILIIGILQSLALSGTQRADVLTGRFDNALEQAGTIPIGSDPTRQEAAIVDALSGSGSTNATVGYSMYGLNPDASPGLQAGVQENDWARTPFPVAYELERGAWPADGEFTVSKALAEEYPLGSTISFFGGALQGRVIGVMGDIYHRSRSLVLVPPGSIAALASLSQKEAQRFSTAVNVDVYWDGPANGKIRKALGQAVENPTLPENNFGVAIQSRELLETRQRNELIEVQLSALLIPLLAGVLSARFGARFVSRIRLTMHKIGIPASRTGRGGHGAVVVATVVGTVIGLFVGYVLVFAIRPILDVVANSTLGPLVDVPGVGSRAILAALVGSLVGLAVFGRAPRTASRVVRGRRGVTLRQVAPAIALALVFVGVRYAQAKSFDDRFLALLAFGLAVMVLGPFVLDLLTRTEPTSFSGRLGIRRLRVDRRASGWVVVGVGVLLVTSFGLSTYITSSLSAGNASTESLIPPHQVELAVPSDSRAAEKSVRVEFEAFTGVSDPLSVRSAGAETVFGDGAVLVLRSTADVERYTAVALTTPQQAMLENGGVLRTKTPDVAQLTLEVYPSTEGGPTRQVKLPAELLTGLDPSYRTRSALMLASTAEALEIPVGSRSLVYTGLSAPQVEKALEAPGEVGFDAGWINAYKAPDVFTEPLSVTLAAGGLSLIGALLLVYYAAASASALRPNLAGLRALGMRRGWLMSALGVQLGAVVGTVLLVAMTAAVVGVAMMLQVAGIDLGLTLPWRAIGVEVLGTLVGSAIAVAVASRRLRPSERME